jgi:hypothetical protein
MGKGGVFAPKWREQCKTRYGLDPLEKIEMGDGTMQYMSGEDMLFLVADNACRGFVEDASRKILQDFRTGRMGPVCLQLAPEKDEDEGQAEVPIGSMDGSTAARVNLRQIRQEEIEKEQQERVRVAVETAKELGLELPPMVENSEVKEDDVGKGLFDGW